MSFLCIFLNNWCLWHEPYNFSITLNHKFSFGNKKKRQLTQCYQDLSIAQGPEAVVTPKMWLHSWMFSITMYCIWLHFSFSSWVLAVKWHSCSAFYMGHTNLSYIGHNKSVSQMWWPTNSTHYKCFCYVCLKTETRKQSPWEQCGLKGSKTAVGQRTVQQEECLQGKKKWSSWGGRQIITYCKWVLTIKGSDLSDTCGMLLL